MALELWSDTFQEEAMIPARHTCDGDDVSPALLWHGVPDGSQSLALILEDIDSVKGVWSHWVVYHVPPGVDRVPEGVPVVERLSWGGVQGRNDFDAIGYGGPCPSDGKTHRYVFRLYALDRWPELDAGETREELLDAMEGHVIAEDVLMGRYKRLVDR